MDPARPLRDVFADLASDENARQAHAADPEGFLEAHGHAELPGELVNEAIVNFADTAPAEVAEHLAPFVMAHSPVPLDAEPGEDGAPGWDAAHGLDLLATAPTEMLDDLALDPDAAAGLAVHEPAGQAPTEHDLAGHALAGDDFGAYSGNHDAADLVHHDGTQHTLDPQDAGAPDVAHDDLAHAGVGSADPFDLDFGHGDFGDGDLGDGDLGDGDLGDGDLGHGDLGHGDLGYRDVGHGDVGHADQAVHMGRMPAADRPDAADGLTHDGAVAHGPDLPADALDEPEIVEHGHVLPPDALDEARDAHDHVAPDDGGPYDG